MSSQQSHLIPFVKMHGCGNDFVLIDNRNLAIAESVMPVWARKICQRAFGIGADGLIFLEAADGAAVDYRWHFYNADGSRAEMCGNGARCAARLAYDIGLAPARHVLETDAGPVQAHVITQGNDEQNMQVKVQLSPAHGMQLNEKISTETTDYTVHCVNTGVPHAVIICDTVQSVDVDNLGRALRMHPHFAPAGTNVNFITIHNDSRIDLRTYERGVEAETFACGTGAAASVLVAHALGHTGTAVAVLTSGKETLHIFLENNDVFLQGSAVQSFSGSFSPEALNLVSS